MFTTASPRVYRFIMQSATTTGCMVEHADTRSWLDPYPRWWGAPAQFNWGSFDYRTVYLAASLLWDVFHNDQIVLDFSLWLAKDVLSQLGQDGGSNWIELDQIADLVVFENAKRHGPRTSYRCEGCGE